MLEQCLYASQIFIPLNIGMRGEEYADRRNILRGKPIHHITGQRVEVKTLVSRVSGRGCISGCDFVRLC